MKSEIRRRLEAGVMPICPDCSSKNVECYRYKPIRFDHVVGYIATDAEQIMDDTYRCNDCKAIFHTEEPEGCEGCDHNEECDKEECDN